MPTWDLDRLIVLDDIKYEQSLLKTPHDLTVWLKYYRSKEMQQCDDHLTIIQLKVSILSRATTALPGSYKIWLLYLDLRTLLLEDVSYISNKQQFNIVNDLFQTSLHWLKKYPVIWQRYLSFLIKTQISQILFIRKEFNRSLFNLPITQHHLIWPLYLEFANKIGGLTLIQTYTKFLQYEIPEDLQTNDNQFGVSIEEIILKLIANGGIKEASALFKTILQNFSKYALMGKSQLQLWLDFSDLISTNAKILLQNSSFEIDSFYEELIFEGLEKFPDQISKFYLKLILYHVKRKNFQKCRYLFDKGLKECVTVRDFIIIFDSFTEFEEKLINEIAAKLELNEDDKELTLDLNIRMTYLEQLIDNRAIYLNDMMLRQDPNNIDEWMKKIEIHETTQNINKVLSSYAEALTTINPFKAHSLSNNANNTYPQIWMNYAKVYTSNKDYKTASVILSKAIQSQFQSPDDLASIYIEWSQLENIAGNYDEAIKIVEDACNFIPENEYEFIDYTDDSIDVHIRLHKSTKLWSYYLDMLESFVESGTLEEIERVSQAFDKLIYLKIATPLNIVNHASFLEDWEYYEKSFTIYELGIKIFKYPISFEIWNIYLVKAITHKLNTERIRDLFEQCLNGDNNEQTRCPPDLCKPIYILYSRFEEENGLILKSLKALKSCIDRLNEGLSQGFNKSKIIQQKCDVYKIIIEKYELLEDISLLRETYSTILQDMSLPVDKLVSFAVKFIDLETKHKEFARVRSLFKHILELKNPVELSEVWEKWQQFELKFGNENEYKELLRYKRLTTTKFETELMLQNSVAPKGFVKATEFNEATTERKDNVADPIENPIENAEEIELDMD